MQVADYDSDDGKETIYIKDADHDHEYVYTGRKFSKSDIHLIETYFRKNRVELN